MNKAGEVRDKLHCGDGNGLQNQMKQDKKQLGVNVTRREPKQACRLVGRLETLWGQTKHFH